MTEASRTDVAILLQQKPNVSDKMLHWIDEISEEKFQAMWEDRTCASYEYLVKLEVFEEASRIVAPQLKMKIRSCCVN